MSMTDLMSAAGLTFYPKVALVIFLVVFAAIIASILRAGKEQHERAARLPLEDDQP